MFKMKYSSHKEIVEKVRQRERDSCYQDNLIREQNLKTRYYKEIDDINKKHTEEINRIHEYYRTQLKQEAQIRLQKYKKIVQERDNLIEELTTKNQLLRDKLKKYVKAYEGYTYLRDHLHQIIDRFRIAADTVSIRGGEISGALNELSDMLSFHQSKMPSLEKKMIETMDIKDSQDHADTQLRLIEKK